MNYLKIYNNIIDMAKNRTTNGYVENHHIVPKCMGGGDGLENLVKLSGREHFICHLLLTKIHPHNNKLRWAFNCMMNWKSKDNKDRYVPNSRIYNIKKINLKHTEETKQKMRKLKHTEETKQKMRNRKISEETRTKLRVPKPSWFGEKVSNALTGKPKSKEHIEKMKVPKSVPSWRKGLIGVTDPTTLLKNKMNQKNRRVIYQFDLEGNLIKIWDSISDATRIYGCGPSHCLAGYQKKSKGYTWKYETTEPPMVRIGGK